MMEDRVLDSNAICEIPVSGHVMNYYKKHYPLLTQSGNNISFGHASLCSGISRAHLIAGLFMKLLRCLLISCPYKILTMTIKSRRKND